MSVIQVYGKLAANISTNLWLANSNMWNTVLFLFIERCFRYTTAYLHDTNIINNFGKTLRMRELLGSFLRGHFQRESYEQKFVPLEIHSTPFPCHYNAAARFAFRRKRTKLCLPNNTNSPIRNVYSYFRVKMNTSNIE